MAFEDNRMFSQMMLAAQARLAAHNCEEIARNTNIRYAAHTKCFSLETLGETIEIRCPGFDINPPLEGWHHLVILHYMDLADGTPLTKRLISFSQMKDGLIRGDGLDRKCEAVIRSLLQQITEKEFIDRCLALGGKELASNADFSVEFPFLPHFPVTLKVWFADDEFDASGRMMLDASADHYLSIEDAVTAGELILEKLMKERTPGP